MWDFAPQAVITLGVVVENIHANISAVSPVTEVRFVFPKVRANLDLWNSFVITGDGTVHRDIYCTPTYFAEDYVERPTYS